MSAAPDIRRTPGVSVFSEPSARSVRTHRMPAWKIVLGHDRPLRVTTADGRTVSGWGLLVPPGVVNSAAAYGGYTAAFVDPGYLRGEPATRVVDLGRRRTRLLRDELDAFDEPRMPSSLADVLGEDRSPAGLAVRTMTPTTSIDDLASMLGVTAQHARRLLREETGSTFTELRRWVCLRESVMTLSSRPSGIADAAASSGFADQAHLTRTCASMLGRTPGTLRTSRTS